MVRRSAAAILAASLGPLAFGCNLDDNPAPPPPDAGFDAEREQPLPPEVDVPEPRRGVTRSAPTRGQNGAEGGAGRRRCTETETVCSDGIDNDCDGRIDCGDPDCRQSRACLGRCVPTAARELRCEGGFDDDCDGLVDCADPDCFEDIACRFCEPREICDNGFDDDCDGLLPERDPDCNRGRFGADCFVLFTVEICLH